MIEDYAKHAAIWDWDGFDNSEEYNYWRKYAEQYGKKVLIPMCALGQIGAYMANSGFHVTAFDITKEMINEGKKRFNTVPNLDLRVADICDFDFPEKGFDFCFIATQDLHLLTNIEMVRKAFKSISGHLRKGACIALELVLPKFESYECPVRIFHPRVPNYIDKNIWKESKNRYDSISKKQYIEQIVYIQDNKGIESFNYSVVLQYFERDEILQALSYAGFSVIGEYTDRNKSHWTMSDKDWLIEAIKQ